MSDRKVDFFIVDIFIAVDKVKRYSNKFNSGEELLYSELEWDAVIRELEIIGEAVNNLLRLEFLGNEYRIIVDFRNQINHGYFGINSNIVWDIVTNYITQFRNELLDIIKLEKVDLIEAIMCAKEDNKFSKKTIGFLDNLTTEINGI